MSSNEYRDNLRKEIHEYNLMIMGCEETTNTALGALIVAVVLMAATVFWLPAWASLLTVVVGAGLMAPAVGYKLRVYREAKDEITKAAYAADTLYYFGGGEDE